MHVINYLKRHGLDKLQEVYAIKARKHENDSRVILNYNQIESWEHRFDPIVRECRGLVLDSSDWSLVCRSFYRFFNLGESQEEVDNFDWQSGRLVHKEDGTLINLYWWNNEWHISTRGSFGDASTPCETYTWRELFKLAFPNWEDLDKKYTYTFELCSMYNKIVTQYPTPVVFLLSIFEGDQELDRDDYIAYSVEKGLLIPSFYAYGWTCENQALDCVECRLKDINDPTFEGYVLIDNKNNRIKIKNRDYVALHRISSNGNLAHPKNLIGFILDGETDEVISYFPEIKTKVKDMEKKIDKFKEELDALWFCFGHEKNRKRYAEKVKGHPLSSIMFRAKDLDVHPLEIFNNYKEILLKHL